MLSDYDREVFPAIALSSASRVIGAHVCHVGTVNASASSPREVFRFCLLGNVRSVLVAHNHPSGNVEPSRADVAISKQFKAAGEAVGVPLVDSVVCGFDGAYVARRAGTPLSPPPQPDVGRPVSRWAWSGDLVGPILDP